MPHQFRRHALRTFPVGDGGNGDGEGGHPPRLDAHCVPTDADMGNFGGKEKDGAVDGGDEDNSGTPPDTRRPATDHNRSRTMSAPRTFAEWKMAAAVVQRELGEGDVIVLDGTLPAGYGGEAWLADALYD